MSGFSVGRQISRWWRTAAALMFAACVNSPIMFAEEPGPSPTLDELLATAEQLRQESQWEDAIETLRKAVARRDENEALAAEAQLRIGKYRLMMAMPAEAEVELRKVATDFPEQREVGGGSRISLIEALMYQDKLDPALEEAVSVAADTNRSPGVRAWAHLRAAEVWQKKGNAEQALSLLEGMADLGVTDETATPMARGMLKRGEILMEKLHRVEAIAALEQAMIAAPADDHKTRNRVRVRLAEVLTHERRFDEAEAACEAVLADHAAGRAEGVQAAWALMWQARVRLGRSSLEGLAEAPERAQMAAGVALDADQPQLAFEAYCLLGEIYSRLSRQADLLVQAIHVQVNMSPAIQRNPSISAKLT